MARKNAIVSVSLNDAANVITFNVADVGTIELPTAHLNSEVTTRAMLHGIIQKVSDAAALGKDASPADKYEAMSAVVSRLLDGEWNKRSGDGSDSAPSGLIFRAFYAFAQDHAKTVKKTPPTEDAVRALYDAKTRAEQLAIRKIPAVAVIMERMKAEKGAGKATVDPSDMLAELGL